MAKIWEEVELWDLERAMILCDHFSIKLARRFLGGTFKEAVSSWLYLDDRGPYEARPLIALAYASRYPTKKLLTPKNFTGLDAHSFLIDNFKFTKEKKWQSK